MQFYLLITTQKLVDIKTAQNLMNLTKTWTTSGAKRTKSSSSTGIAMQKRLAKSIGCSNQRQSQTILKSSLKFLVKKNLIIYLKDALGVTNLGIYTGPLFFSLYDSFYSSFLLYLLRLSHLSTPVSQNICLLIYKVALCHYDSI